MNLNKKTLKNIEQIQFRNGRMMTGGDPTEEERLAKLKAAKQRIASAEESLDDQMEEGPSSSVQAESLSVQAEAVDDSLKKGVSVEAQPFSGPYGPELQGSTSGSKPNFDAVAQGLKEYINQAVAEAVASSSSSSSSNEDMQNPVSSVSTAVETTEEGLQNLKSPSPSSLESGEFETPPEPSAPPAEGEQEEEES